jgi:surface carbohydrate biosynthesis protein
MRPIYLLIEEVNRELLSRLLIGRAAAALGHPVLIGQQWWIAANFEALPPGAVLFKGNNRIQALFMQQARKAGHLTASIDEESFVSSSATEIKAQYHALAEAHCDLFLTQGAFQHRTILDHFPAAAERVVMTGNPRTDLLRDENFRPKDPRVDHYRAEVGPFTLINTNFTTINPKLGDTYSYYQTCLRVGVLDDPEMPPYQRFMTWCRWERYNLRAMTTLIHRLVTGSGDRRIVVRPHPSENAEIWVDRLAGLHGVDVQSEGDHLAWIDRADILVHSGCSTGLEAYLLGRPAISLTPGDTVWKTPALSNIVNPVAATVDEAEALLRTPRTDIGGNALDDYLLDTRDPTPAERIAGQLSALSERAGDRATAASSDDAAAPASQRMIEKAFIDLAEVRRRLRQVEAATGIEKPAPIKEIAPAIFQIGEGAPLHPRTGP